MENHHATNYPMYQSGMSLLILFTLLLSPCTGVAPAAAPAATEAAAEEVPAAAEATGEPLKIGVMSDLSGGLALFGNEMWEGLQLGFAYATDGSMVAGGRPSELIIKDDTSTVDAGAAAARELIEAEGVEVLIGNSSSAVALQVQQIATENDVVYFAAPAASPDITGKNFNDHTFRVCRNSAQDPMTVAKWALENVGAKYLILAEDYAFGQATAAGFQTVFSGMGSEFLSEEPISPLATRPILPPTSVKLRNFSPMV